MHSTDTAESWAAQINASALDTIDSILKLGRLFIAAKNSLPHGEYGRLFALSLTPFSQRSADVLAQIARHPLLSNSQHAANLPPSWSILANLSRFPAEFLENKIKAGALTATTSRTAVRAWKIAAAAPPPPAGARRVNDNAARRARLDTIRQLADEGHRSDQIAAAVGLDPRTLRAMMKRAGIACPADVTIGKARRLDAVRILDHLVQSAEDIADDERLIDFDRLPRDRLDAWITSLGKSQRAIGRFITRLRQRKDAYGLATQTDPSHVEDPAGSDQSHDRPPGVC